ncbi:MAG: hypothetical protein JO306_15375 [Gemmatimonadetes bacterium]|nr:hypothetical protein [Gemmatimonadota bacterium]
MNAFELRLEEYAGTTIFIDGVDFRELVRQAELPYAAADGQPQLAGSYRGIRSWDWADLPDQRGDGRAAVLGCWGCGIVECWPLRVRITREGDTVTWSDFHQSHRPKWKHEGLGPFVFSAQQYDAEVARFIIPMLPPAPSLLRDP